MESPTLHLSTPDLVAELTDALEELNHPATKPAVRSPTGMPHNTTPEPQNATALAPLKASIRRLSDLPDHLGWPPGSVTETVPRRPQDLREVLLNPPPVAISDTEKVGPLGRFNDQGEYIAFPRWALTRHPSERGRRSPEPEYIAIQPNMCWNCGKTGHRRSTCQGKKIIFCSRCGQQGVMSRYCWCAGEEAMDYCEPRFDPRRPRRYTPAEWARNRIRPSHH